MAIAPIGSPLRNNQLLSASWLLRLVQEAGYDVPQITLSVEPFTIGRHDQFHIDVMAADTVPWITAVSSDPAHQPQIDELVRRSGELVAAGDLGGHVWYSTGLIGEDWIIDALFMSRIQEMLTNHVRITGWRRLGWHVLLEFREEFPDGAAPVDSPFAPRAVVDVHVAAPGPVHGPLSEPIAHRLVEEVAAICSFALGRPVNLPPSVFPSAPETVADLDRRRDDVSMLGLARNGISLDIFDDLFQRGGMLSVDRARGAFLSFDAALRQQREQVALIMYVVAAECLTNPYQPWKTERLTTRFIAFFDELMPDALDELVQHGNFEVAFGITRGSRSARALRREFLSTLYNLRSEPVHEGLSASFQGMAEMGSSSAQRRALASVFAQNAILSFLQSPRTSLIGHSATAPAEN